MLNYRVRTLALRLLVGLAILTLLVLENPSIAALKAAPRAHLAEEAPAAQVQAPVFDHQARRILDQTSIYDPTNPDRARLQEIREATRHLPYDPVGFPDWMKALREGSIQPRSDLSGKGKMDVLDLDIIMKNTKEMPYVRFPHNSHTMWLSCSNCHPSPFQPVAGSTTITMADIFRGRFCGVCHDRVAFITFFSCSRCHSVPQSLAK